MILPAVTQLLVIQDRDRKLRQLKIELKNAPLEKKAMDTRLATASATLEASKLKAKEIEVKRKELENEVRAQFIERSTVECVFTFLWCSALSQRYAVVALT